MAAPTVVGVSSTGNWEADGSIVADLQGAASGRLLLAGTFVRLAAQTVNLPSASPGAWTLKSGDNETATATSGEIAGKVAGGSETAPTLSTGLTGGPQGTGGIVISVDGWSGTLTDVVASTPNGGASSTIPAPSVASAPDQSLVLRVYFNADNNTITNDAGAGGTQIFTQVVGTLGRLALHVYAGVQSGAGATGAASLVVSGSDGYLAWTIVIPPAVGGGPVTVAVGQALEADTATAVTRAKQRAAGQAAETDTATLVGRRKTRPLGMATVTETARPITARRSRTVVVGQALEAATATAVTRRKALLVGQAAEFSTAGPITPPSSNIVPRPNTGSVARPAGGTVTRPNTGIVTRP